MHTNYLYSSTLVRKFLAKVESCFRLKLLLFKINTTFSLTTPQADVVKGVSCLSTIGQTQLKPSAFGESSDEEDDDKAGINQMLQRGVTQKRNTKQVQQKKAEDPEFDKVYYRITEGKKMAVATKLCKNKELKPQDEQQKWKTRKRD